MLGKTLEPPLFGFEWNETAPPGEVEFGLLSIFARDQRSDRLQAIGTGFVITGYANGAVACSAAHLFAEVRRLQQDVDRVQPHASAIAEFLPEPRAVDLALRGLAVVGRSATERAVFARVEGLAFDEAADVAVLQVVGQRDCAERIFQREFLLDDRLPGVGDLVEVVSYADLRCQDSDGRTEVHRRPVSRVGRVLEVFPDGHRLCRGPCVETSIPLYSGMSGGPVTIYDPANPRRVFGFVCSDPDRDGPEKNDRSVAGRSLIAKLPCVHVVRNQDGTSVAELGFIPSSVAGQFRAPT
jgi:hypothetical protein